MGAPRDQAARVAGNARRWWHNSRYELNRLLPMAYFDRLGVPRLSRPSTPRTARCGPACRGLWEGSVGGADRPYPDFFARHRDMSYFRPVGSVPRFGAGVRLFPRFGAGVRLFPYSIAAGADRWPDLRSVPVSGVRLFTDSIAAGADR